MMLTSNFRSIKNASVSHRVADQSVKIKSIFFLAGLSWLDAHSRLRCESRYRIN